MNNSFTSPLLLRQSWVDLDLVSIFLFIRNQNIVRSFKYCDICTFSRQNLVDDDFHRSNGAKKRNKSKNEIRKRTLERKFFEIAAFFTFVKNTAAANLKKPRSRIKRAALRPSWLLCSAKLQPHLCYFFRRLEHFRFFKLNSNQFLAFIQFLWCFQSCC